MNTRRDVATKYSRAPPCRHCMLMYLVADHWHTLKFVKLQCFARYSVYSEGALS